MGAPKRNYPRFNLVVLDALANYRRALIDRDEAKRDRSRALSEVEQEDAQIRYSVALSREGAALRNLNNVLMGDV